MHLPHVFVDPADCDDHRIRLHGPVAHHVLTVVRCGPGDSRDAFADAEHGVVFREEAPTPLRDVSFDVRVDRIIVGVGPEGGLTADEVEQTGLPAVGPGPTILRAETAGVVAPALVLQRLGRLG